MNEFWGFGIWLLYMSLSVIVGGLITYGLLEMACG